MKSAAICIATYRRPTGLSQLLTALASLEVPERWHVETRVVNNDPEGNPVAFRQSVHRTDILVRTASEPRRNIAHARNTAIAMGHADVYVFIDDDEIPSAGWLQALLQRFDQGDADAVIGPVIGRVPDTTPRWLVRTGVFDKPGPNHDGPVSWKVGRTSSTLVSAEFIGRDGLWFDPAYGTSGGSDTDFFRRAYQHGARLVHERRAFVYEDIEPDRCTWQAVLRRRYRAGVVFGRMNRASSQLGRVMGLVKRITIGGVEAVIGAAAAPLIGPGLGFRGICRCAVGLGAFRGFDVDYTVERYPERKAAA